MITSQLKPALVMIPNFLLWMVKPLLEPLRVQPIHFPRDRYEKQLKSMLLGALLPELSAHPSGLKYFRKSLAPYLDPMRWLLHREEAAWVSRLTHEPRQYVAVRLPKT